MKKKPRGTMHFPAAYRAAGDDHHGIESYMREFERRNGLKPTPIEFGPRTDDADQLCALHRILCRSEK